MRSFFSNTSSGFSSFFTHISFAFNLKYPWREKTKLSLERIKKTRGKKRPPNQSQEATWTTPAKQDQTVSTVRAWQWPDLGNFDGGVKFGMRRCIMGGRCPVMGVFNLGRWADSLSLHNMGDATHLPAVCQSHEPKKQVSLALLGVRNVLFHHRNYIRF